MRWMIGSIILAGISSVVGCVPVYPDSRQSAQHAPTPTPLASDFQPQKCGTIRGRILWRGAKPNLPEVLGAVPTKPGEYSFQKFPAPFQPRIADDGGLAGVLISLEGVNPAQAKPWDLPPVRLVWQAGRLRCEQFPDCDSLGIVRQGEEVPIEARDTIPHVLRGRGADFFALPFPIGSASKSRRFPQLGLVELSSGMGYFWAMADLHVVTHPYYAVTDSRGHFELKQVPAGEHRLSATLRQWTVTGQERDPETGLVFRQSFDPAWVQNETRTIAASAMTELNLSFPVDQK